jgi:glucose-1-phosphate adenylyltransferase
VFAYDFQRNRVPGLRGHEHPWYWRDVGTLDAYAAARDEVRGPRPLLCMDNPAWPIGARAGQPGVLPVPVHGRAEPQPASRVAARARAVEAG